MIELAVILAACAVIADACLVALQDIAYERARVDRRFRRRG